MEIWKKIKGYDNYEISNIGNVRSLERVVKSKGGFRTNRGCLLKVTIVRGYRTVNIYKDNKPRNLKIARCVGQTFIDNPLNLPVINHKDGNKLNDTLENLEWATYSENIIHAYRTGLRSNISPVTQLDTAGNVIRYFDSIHEAERHGFDKSNICMCCKGRRKSHKGFKWKYS